VNGEKSWRGGERQTLLLASALQQLGVVSRIACRVGSPLEAQALKSGIETHALAGDAVRAAWAISRYAGDCDAIHCHTGRAHGLATASVLLRDKPVVVTRRVMFEPKNSWFTRYKYRTAAKIVCISRSIATQMQEWGVPAHQLTVIPDAIPLPAAPPRVQELRSALSAPDHRRIVGCIGALTAEKDHATFLRAAREVAARNPDVHFVVIGEGDLKDELLRLRADLGLEGKVQFAGFIPHAEEYIGAFDVFVLCSRSEGLGSILLDAFASNVPVVATAVGGVPELVSDDATGLLVPAGEPSLLAAAIERLLSDRALSARLAATARARVECEYTVQRMAERYLAVYEEALLK
jgi:L-malate glycosyltransferase